MQGELPLINQEVHIFSDCNSLKCSRSRNIYHVLKVVSEPFNLISRSQPMPPSSAVSQTVKSAVQKDILSTGSAGELGHIINLQTSVEPANRLLFLQSSEGSDCLAKQLHARSASLSLCALSLLPLFAILLHVARVFFLILFVKYPSLLFLLSQAHSGVRSQLLIRT